MFRCQFRSHAGFTQGRKPVDPLIGCQQMCFALACVDAADGARGVGTIRWLWFARRRDWNAFVWFRPGNLNSRHPFLNLIVGKIGALILQAGAGALNHCQVRAVISYGVAAMQLATLKEWALIGHGIGSNRLNGRTGRFHVVWRVGTISAVPPVLSHLRGLAGYRGGRGVIRRREPAF